MASYNWYAHQRRNIVLGSRKTSLMMSLRRECGVSEYEKLLEKPQVENGSKGQII